MGPMPYGGYNGSLCKEFAVDVMRKKEYCHEQLRDGNKSYCGDLQFRSKREGMGNESVRSRKSSNICNSNLSGKSDKAQLVGFVPRSLGDLESGELCSEDSSGIEDEFMVSGDMVEAFSGRKRKFSSIECLNEGMEDIDFRQMNRNKERSSIAVHSDSSLTLKVFEPASTKKVQRPKGMLTDPKNSIDFIHDLHLGNENEPDQMKKECVTASTYSFSRWADANGDDEGVISDVEISVNRRKYLLLNSAQDRRAELGEVIFKEGSERSTSNASGSGGSCQEDCLESIRDGIDDLDDYGEDSNVGEGNGSLREDCNAYTMDYAASPYKSMNMLQACRNVDDFDKLNKINEGAYGTVYRARDKKTGEIVALKKVKMQKEREGFPLTSLREINILLSLHHSSIVEVKEVVVGRDLDDIFIVMQYMEHDLKGLLQTMKKPFHLSEVKCLMLQLLTGVKHLHDNWVLHRDLKTSNLLFNNRGELKICDFGLSRQYGSPLKPYTKLVVTLWYRAPELLLGAIDYSTAIDMWSVGCMMAELLNREPLFPGKSELDQLDKIFRILGTPDEDSWPGLKQLPGAKVDFIKKPFKLHEKFPRKSPTSFLGGPVLSSAGFNLLNRLLTYDPEKRITAGDALDHPWFRESPLPMSKDFMPTYPAQHTKVRHLQRSVNGTYPLEQLGVKDSQYLGACSSLDNRKLMMFFSNDPIYFWGDEVLFFPQWRHLLQDFLSTMAMIL